MREYELTVLIHPDLEADLETPLKAIRTIITTAGGTVTSEDNWGKKRLAYRIAREDFAVYVFFEVSLPAASVARVDGALNIEGSVLRHLLVAVDHKGRAALADEATRSDKDTNESEEE